MIKNYALLIACVSTLIMSSCSQPKKEIPQTNDTRFERFREEFVNELFRISPSVALNAGNHNYDSLLIVTTDDRIKEENTAMNVLMDSIKTFDENELTDLNKIDLWMMRDWVNSGLWYNNEFKAYQWNPATFNVANDFAMILNGSYDKLDARLRNFSKRLSNVPAYYGAATINITEPTIEHTDLAILQNEGSIEEVFGSALKDSVNASGLSDEEKNTLLTRTDNARSAMKSYVNWLKNKRKTMTPENSRSFRIGKALYDKKFEYNLVSKYTAEQIFEKAKSRRNELHQEMANISRKLWSKYFGVKSMPDDSLVLIRKMIDTLSVQHVRPDSFMSSIEQQIPKLVSFINDHKLIYIDPSKPLQVRKMPGYMEGSGAGASISAPGPYDKNANTYYNVSPLTGYKPAEAESYLREYNSYILQILNIHEAIPGHYTQLVYSNNSPSIIKSLLGNNAMIEGWAVYGERMMVENGYGSDPQSKSTEATPEMWLMYYKWHLRSVCNTILDYSVHVLNMSEADAKKLLVDGAFQQQAEADGKWRRVKLSQVQLCCYYTGFTEIYDLREDLKKSAGDTLDLKAFHEKFLSYGSAPVKYIGELMRK